MQDPSKQAAIFPLHHPVPQVVDFEFKKKKLVHLEGLDLIEHRSILPEEFNIGDPDSKRLAWSFLTHWYGPGVGNAGERALGHKLVSMRNKRRSLYPSKALMWYLRSPNSSIGAISGGISGGLSSFISQKYGLSITLGALLIITSVWLAWYYRYLPYTFRVLLSKGYHNEDFSVLTIFKLSAAVTAIASCYKRKSSLPQLLSSLPMYDEIASTPSCSNYYRLKSIRVIFESRAAFLWHPYLEDLVNNNDFRKALFTQPQR